MPKERLFNKPLRDELKTHRDAGEKDICIRRGKIVPRPAGTGTSAHPSYWLENDTGVSRLFETLYEDCSLSHAPP